ncbi:MAG TPA: diguanylate cyclase, partial [Thermoanaerobaculia bacterium]|nr:diguanylate cyclase [Thermoanaerobaculia bacterium]
MPCRVSRWLEIFLSEEVIQRIPDVAGEKRSFEELVTSISTRFINLRAHEIDDGIRGALRQVGEFAGVDRSYLFLCSSDGLRMSNTHEWCAPGIEPQIDSLQDMPFEIMPWWAERLRSRETIHIPRVSDMPPDAAADRK